MKKLLLAATAAIASIAAPAFAATDGNLSTGSSVGTAVFTTVIPPMVRISGLSDMTINVTPAALTSPYFNFEDANTKFCVYSNVGAAGTYSIKVDGTAGTAHPYRLTGVGGNLDYSVWVSDNANDAFQGAGTAGNGYTFPGSVKTGYTTTRGGGARPTTLDCSGSGSGPDASLEVRVTNADVLAAQAGSYSGTLTLTVSAI